MSGTARVIFGIALVVMIVGLVFVASYYLGVLNDTSALSSAVAAFETEKAQLVADVENLEIWNSSQSTQIEAQQLILRDLAATAEIIPGGGVNQDVTPTPWDRSYGVMIEGNNCCVGGAAGETINVTVQFQPEWSDLATPAVEMRVITGMTNVTEVDMVNQPWEPVVDEKIYPVNVAINWNSFWVHVQYRTADGIVSSIYSDEIGVEITDSATITPEDIGSIPPEIGPDMISLNTTLESYQGRIDFPYKTADAGNFWLQPGEIISFNWLDFPPGATFYTIAIKTEEEQEQLIKIGTDFDSSDGIMIEWKVQERIWGQVTGFACFEDGTCIGAEWSGLAFSGILPPEQFCTIKLFNIGPEDIYLEPDEDSPIIAYLTPLTYARVYEILEDQWVMIDLTNPEYVAEYYSQEYSSISKGYVPQRESLELFGPCDSLIEN